MNPSMLASGIRRLRGKSKIGAVPLVLAALAGVSPLPASLAAGEEIHGRVLDAEGRPVKDARLHWPRLLKHNSPRLTDALEYVERGRSDDEGRFRIQLPAGEDLGDSLRTLIVTASGYGLSWIELPKGKSSEELTLRLSKDATIQGHIVSTEGRPLAGVSVRVDHLEEMPYSRLDQYLTFWEQEWLKVNALKTRRLEVPVKQSILPSAITDKEGRFQLSGVGRERIVHLDIQGKDIAHSLLPVVARPGFDPAVLNKSARNRARMISPFAGLPPVLYGPSLDFVASPERIVQGVVREAGSGKPIPGVRIYGSGAGNRITDSMALTDKNGRYRLEGLPKMKRYPYLASEPPWESSWLSVSIQNAEAGEGMQPVQVDFTLGRGVILTGQVIDRTTGKGVASSIAYDYLPDNKFAGKPGYDSGRRAYGSDADGRFRIKVAPGTGVLKAHAGGAVNRFLPARLDAQDRKHVTLTADGDFITLGGGTGFLTMYNAAKRLDLAPDAGEVKRNLYPERGATATVCIQDPEGKPLTGVIVSGIDAIPGQHYQKAYVSPKAECAIVALEPRQPRQVIFYYAERSLAGSLTVRGDEKKPLTVRLAPTGSVIGRVRDAEGKAIQGADIELWAKGPPASPSLVYLYLGLNGKRLHMRTDKDGRFRLEGIVPDAKFDIDIRHRGRYVNNGSRTKKLQVKAGETLDLGDIVIKPAE